VIKMIGAFAELALGTSEAEQSIAMTVASDLVSLRRMTNSLFDPSR
jgi:hypothetical protein